MRISSPKLTSNSIKNSQSFGYNKKYHEELHEKLNAKGSNYAKELVKMDEFALSVEDKVVEFEKKRRINSNAYSDLTDLLVDLRETFARQINMKFPEMGYIKSASNFYMQEAENKKNEDAILWREVVSGAMAAYTFKPSENSAPQKEALTQSETENAAPKEAQTQQTQQQTQTKPTVSSKYVTLYEPTKYSPKGFEDVAGMEDIKERLQDEVLTYIKNPELEQLDFEEYGIRAPRGFLLYGPPGCGKTFIASALAAEAGVNMYKMDLSKIGSKYVNQTSNNIQEAFESIEKYTNATGEKVILFMDEVDALAMDRNSNVASSGENEKTTATLLKFVEGARDKGIIVFAATNRFDNLDEAFKARFDGQYYIGLPDEEAIEKLVQKELSKKQKGQVLASKEDEIKELSRLFKGHSNRSIVFILDEAGKLAKKENRTDINSSHVKKAVETSELEKPKEEKYQTQKNKPKRQIGFSALA